MRRTAFAARLKKATAFGLMTLALFAALCLTTAQAETPDSEVAAKTGFTGLVLKFSTSLPDRAEFEQ